MGKRIFALLLAAVLLSGCAIGQNKEKRTLFCMDTVMDLQLWGKDAGAAAERIEELLKDLEQTWSAADEASVLSQMNRGEGTLTQVQREVLDQAEALSQRTGGAFNPKLYSLTCLWGFPSGEYHVPNQEEISAAMEQVQWDLGAAIKGYAGQQAAELLAGMDVDRGILNLGGNVQIYGEKPDGESWQIAIQNPRGGEPIGVVSVTGTTSIVTSGDYQRYFEENGVRYHHILDPETGCPADSGLASVTVICRDGMTADALSTALFVMGLEQASRLWRESDDFEAVFISTAGEIYATQGVNLSGCEFEVISR